MTAEQVEAKYPVMTIHSRAVEENARKVVSLCAKQGIDVWGVTKGLSGDPRLAKIYESAGMKGVADSRLINLAEVKKSGVTLPRQMMRIAMPTELEELLKVADVSLQSDVSTILRLDDFCVAKNTAHDILLMLDVGDLREGFWPKEIAGTGAKLRDLRALRVVGVATNFACASGVLPTREKLEDLVSYRDRFAHAIGRELPVISVGGTCCLKAIEEGTMPREVNQLRICEGILLGFDTAHMREISYLSREAVVISAEVVECREKPSVPDGEVGLQAFGEHPIFIDRGMRKRALLAIGRQDVNISRLAPVDEGVHIVTASSDHMIVDVTEAKRPFVAGDILDFRAQYPAMLGAATSRYVSVTFR